MARSRRWSPVLAGLLPLVVSAAWARAEFVLPAPEQDRAVQVIELTNLPAGFETGAWELQTEEGERLPVDASGVPRGAARSVIPLQRAGHVLHLSLQRRATSGQPQPQPTMTVAVREADLEARVGTRAILSWQLAHAAPAGIDPVFNRSAFLHPIYTPDGHLVTDAFPPDHLHQGGLWMAWTRSNFRGEPTEFWNLAQGKGRIEAGPVLETWDGQAMAGFEAVRYYVALLAEGPVNALRETWRVRVFDLPALRVNVFDVEVTQACATEDPVNIEEYHYGGIAIRGNRQWNGADNAYFLTSSGETDREAANGSRVRWCYMGGVVDGAPAGVAILGHPENFRAPEPVRVHPREPYFCFAPSRLGSFTIRPGVPHRARYRLVVGDGPVDAALLDACWLGFVRDIHIDVAGDRERAARHGDHEAGAIPP